MTMDTQPRPAAGYPYNRLLPGTIRLIRLYAGTYLMCDLVIAHLNLLPSYEAISYCWGDSEGRLPITCNGVRGLQITKNLHSALQRLQLPNQPRLLWADAICINQDDTEERGSQVRLMKDIYRGASSVTIWLGEAIEVDGKDIWPIPSLLEAAQKNLKRTELPIRHDTKDWVRYVLRPDYRNSGDLDDKKWNRTIKSLILLLHKPWFLRTWIIQEVALANTALVMCGNHSATWDEFHRSVSYAIGLDYLSATLPEIYSSILNIEHVRRSLARDVHSRPLDLLASFKCSLATDARDKVFGLYSLFSSCDLPLLELQPDYTMDIIKVYTQSALDCIATEGSLDVLSFSGQSCSPGHIKLPTWVPDWSFHDRSIPLSPRFLSILSFEADSLPSTWQSATGKSSPIVELTLDPKVIKLSDYIFDEITEVGGVLEREYFETQPGHSLLQISSILKSGTETFAKWEDICGVTTNTTYWTGEAAWDVYWKTLHAGIFPYGDEESTKDAFEKWYQIFRDIRSFGEYTTNKLHEIKASEASATSKVAVGVGWIAKTTYKSMKIGTHLGLNMNKLRSSKMLAFYRTLFKTKKGHVGIASRHAKVGHSIAFFEGGKLPMVVIGNDAGHSALVGDAYIHGIMGGDAFVSAKCGMMSFQ